MLFNLEDPRLLAVEDAVAVKAAAEVVVVSVVMAVKAAAVVAVVSVVTAVKAAVAVAAVVVVTAVKAAEEAAPELKVAMVKAALTEVTENREVVSPDKIGSKASLVKKPIQWTDRTALVVAAVAIARTVIAEADGVAKMLNPTPITRSMPPKKRRRRQPGQSLSPLRKKKRRLVPLLMSTERNKLLAPRDFSLKQKKQEPERRFKRRLWEEKVRRRASLESTITSHGEISTL